MKIMLTDLQNQDLNKFTLTDEVFGTAFNEPLVHQIVTAYLAGNRSGTKAQKGWSDVRGGGKKPWRQKGTGRARAGSIRSPLWRGGAKTFPASPRDYSQKVNKKMYRGAMRSILSELARQNILKVIESIKVESHKTKDIVKQFAKLDVQNGVLIICDNIDENLYLATRNLSHVEVIDVQEMDPVVLLKYRTVIATVPAIQQIEEWLK
ncbi:MAG: 50S ribosomal protein L4 [Gammaproteobacteria bacterium]|nr:50S ribosomal protein L4 [Gammaproteobacteria bacterium]MBU2545971.1 50S ribosomal protein L4 [Gammaproteobacteria bacterium]